MADQIRLGDVTPRVRYIADGITSIFSFPFPVFADVDLEVYVDDILQTLSVAYEVSGTGSRSGGTVTFLAAPTANANVTPVRRLTIKRLSDFETCGNFAAVAINDELDFQTAVLQQVNDDRARCVCLAASDKSASMLLPAAAARAGRSLAFDADGEIVAPAFVDMSAGPVISGSTPLLDTAGGDAGASGEASAADHRHPLPTWSDIGIATQTEAEAGEDHSRLMTPLRMAQAMSALGKPEDTVSRSMAASALAYVMASADSQAISGSVGAFELVDTFSTDSLTTSANATYDAAGGYYHNPVTLSSTDAVPAMTDYTTSGVTIAESGSSGGHESWRVFDDMGDPYASSWSAAGNTNQWLSVDLGTSTTIAAYRLRPRNIDSYDLPMAPTAFHLDGWNGSGWDVLDNRTGVSWGSHAFQQFPIASPAAYSSYRFYGVSNASGYEISIGEMELLPLTDPPDMTLEPTAMSLTTGDPLDILGYFIVEPIGEATFGTDIVGSFSIDGGTTFAAGSWTKIGDIGGIDRQLYRLDANVSAQSGSSLTYRLTTANATQVRLHQCVGLVAVH